jgi:L-ascorbate metabolism protein UlaG (beta-lactamase superfamily)
MVGGMRIVKHEHACVRLEDAGQVLVLDPGSLTSPEAVDGATAVLITHEHADHYDPERLRRTDAPVWTIEAVAAKIRQDAPDVAERVTVVRPGDKLDVGVPVEVVGETHAEILPDLHFDNSGYLVTLGDTRLFHPGDALTVPPQPVDVLLLPVSAPWLKASECVGYAREVDAPRSIAIHDMVYSDFGLGVIDTHLRRILEPAGQDYQRLAPGEEA